MQIPLSQGKFAIIDEVDAHLAQWRWYYGPSGYPSRHFKITPGRKGKRGMVFLHQAILGRSTKGLECDHINGVRLDCRRENLRFVSKRENTSNQKCHRGEKPKSSKYIGVCWTNASKTNPWLSGISVNGKKVRLGNFKTQELASKAYQGALENVEKISSL